MGGIEDKITLLGTRIDTLVNRNDQLKKKVLEQQETIQSLNDSLHNNEQSFRELKEKYKLLKLAKSINRTDEKTSDVKLKINELVKEIDRCIGMLNS